MSARNVIAVIFFAIVALFLVFGALMVHPFGPEEGQDGFDAPMDQYIIDNTQNETGADNGVTAVVFDYRGFDTLGEATVLFTSVIGVAALMRKVGRKK